MDWQLYQNQRKLECMLIDIKTHCILIYDNRLRCNRCSEDYIHRLIIHHKQYFSDSVIFWSYGNYLGGRVNYYSQLINEIEKRKDNFETLCNKCHTWLHKKEGDKE